MSNELIVINQTTAVAVLSTDDGVKTLLENVRANIDNMGGGSMKNKTSRAKIRSNAFAATKAYKKINDETIEPLIANLTAKIQPQLNVINAIRDNQSVLKSGLQKIRKDVNEDVDAFEANLKRVEDEKIELERVATVERDREFATMMYSEYLAQVALGDSILVDWQKVADAKIEADRVIREKKIADDAAETARLKAESDARAEIKRIEDQNKMTIDHMEAINDNHEIDKLNAKALAEQQAQAAVQSKIDAGKAETKRLADIEQTKVDTEKRIVSERIAANKKALDESNLREKNKAKYQKTMGETKRSIMALGVPEEFATLVTQGLRHGSVDHVGKIQF
jgi:hypothetical protein